MNALLGAGSTASATTARKAISYQIQRLHEAQQPYAGDAEAKTA